MTLIKVFDRKDRLSTSENDLKNTFQQLQRIKFLYLPGWKIGSNRCANLFQLKRAYIKLKRFKDIVMKKSRVFCVENGTFMIVRFINIFVKSAEGMNLSALRPIFLMSNTTCYKKMVKK